MSSEKAIIKYACRNYRRVFQFLSRRIKTGRKPVCPQCANKKLVKEVSRFAMLKGGIESNPDEIGNPEALPDFDDPRMRYAMSEMERTMAHMMQDVLPQDLLSKEINDAISRLEAGEDPDKIEEDMGEIFDQVNGARWR